VKLRLLRKLERFPACPDLAERLFGRSSVQNRDHTLSARRFKKQSRRIRVRRVALVVGVRATRFDPLEPETLE